MNGINEMQEIVGFQPFMTTNDSQMEFDEERKLEIMDLETK